MTPFRFIRLIYCSKLYWSSTFDAKWHWHGHSTCELSLFMFNCGLTEGIIRRLWLDSVDSKEHSIITTYTTSCRTLVANWTVFWLWLTTTITPIFIPACFITFLRTKYFESATLKMCRQDIAEVFMLSYSHSHYASDDTKDTLWYVKWSITQTVRAQMNNGKAKPNDSMYNEDRNNRVSSMTHITLRYNPHLTPLVSYSTTPWRLHKRPLLHPDCV